MSEQTPARTWTAAEIAALTRRAEQAETTCGDSKHQNERLVDRFRQRDEAVALLHDAVDAAMSDPSPTLREFLTAYDADDNAWWRLSSGDHQNLFDELRDLRDAQQEQIAALTRSWRCFHCDEVFTDEAKARIHFGPELGSTPTCQVRDRDDVGYRYTQEVARALASSEVQLAAAEIRLRVAEGQLAHLREIAKMALRKIDKCSLYGPADAAREAIEDLRDVLLPVETTPARTTFTFLCGHTGPGNWDAVRGAVVCATCYPTPSPSSQEKS